VVVTNEGVDAQQADEREVAQHAQHIGLLGVITLQGAQPEREVTQEWRVPPGSVPDVALSSYKGRVQPSSVSW
jgi:hypothetical protein